MQRSRRRSGEEASRLKPSTTDVFESPAHRGSASGPSPRRSSSDGHARSTPRQRQRRMCRRPTCSVSELGSVRPTARAPENQPAPDKQRSDSGDPGKIDAGERKCSRPCTRRRSGGPTKVARCRRRSSVAIDDGVTTECTPHQSESGGDNRHDQKCALQPFSSWRADR